MSRRWFALLLLLTALALAAVASWRRVLQRRPAGPLAIAGREAASSADTPAAAVFQDASDVCGIDFRHHTDRPGSYFLPEIMGSGCALLDFNQDGRLDAFFVDLGTGYVQAGGAVPHPGQNKLFQQRPDGTYVDVSDAAGLANLGLGMGVAVGDVNNDGFPDVYLTSFGPDLLYLNRRDGTFSDVTSAAGIENRRWGASACFVDYDQDGWLDLFVTNYVDFFPRRCDQLAGGHPDYCGPHVFPGTPDKLYRNITGDDTESALPARSDGGVRFVDVSATSGIAAKSGPGLGVLAADFTGDGRPDLYVANDQTANFLWVNQGDGTFRDEAVLRGCAYDLQGNAQASMGTAMADVDGDTTLELLLTHLDGEFNTLYRADSGAFVDASIETGVGPPSLAWTGFGVAFGDLELDGDVDLLLVNGRVRRPPDAAAAIDGADFWSPYRQHAALLLNDHGHFQVDRNSSDQFLATAGLGRGLALGDLDNDGDLDAVVNRVGARAGVFHNVAERRGSWLIVQAVDPQRGGRDAYGALVTVVAGARRWRRLVQPGTGYLSSQDPRVHFGLGATEQIDGIEVQWPDGSIEWFSETAVNRIARIARGQGAGR